MARHCAAHWQHQDLTPCGPAGAVNYVSDGDTVLEEMNNSGTVVARYTTGSGVDEPLAMNRGGATGVV